MKTRRSFLLLLVAALAAAPLLCRARKLFPFSFLPYGRPPLELWEMESNWDGTLSPWFLEKHQGYDPEGIVRKWYLTTTKEERERIQKESVETAFAREFSYPAYLAQVQGQWVDASGGKTEPGSFADSIFPKT